MASLFDSINPKLAEWIAAVAMFVIMFLLAGVARWVLRSRQLSRYGSILSELAPPISNLIVVFAMSVVGM